MGTSWIDDSINPSIHGGSRVRAGGEPRVEIMIPLVGDVRELDIMAGRARRILDEGTAETGSRTRSAP
jgi:hypothetical protein